jgi:hypothetical protein
MKNAAVWVLLFVLFAAGCSQAGRYQIAEIQSPTSSNRLAIKIDTSNGNTWVARSDFADHEITWLKIPRDPNESMMPDWIQRLNSNDKK